MNTIYCLNRKAKFDFEIHKIFEAGVVLLGSEVKAIKNNKANISDAYVFCDKNEIFVMNFNIQRYKFSTLDFEHNPLRKKKLLLHKYEIKKIQGILTKKGYTMILTQCYLKHGLIKTEIAIVTARKKQDKKEYLKEKDINRELRKYND